MALALRPGYRALLQAFGTTVAFSLLLQPALAEEKVQKIQVTGSSIKRSVAAEGALPVEVLKAQTMEQMGVTSVQGALQLISANQTTLGASQSIGSTTGGQSAANLRGIGADKTLVLLNGRRIANFALDGGSVDLNALPLAAIDRIEVLKDGASAIYGTDAVGGVINFITKDDFTGVGVEANYLSPEQAGGGRTYGASLSAGFGSLSENKFNVFGVLTAQRTDPLEAMDRSYAKTGFKPELAYKSSGTTFPGNWSQSSSGTKGNPTYPNCKLPSSFAAPDFFGPDVCRYDYVSKIQLIPSNEQLNFLGRGQIAYGDGHTFSLEYTYANNKAEGNVSEVPVAGLTMSPTNPYFPGAGITPGAPGDPNANVRVGWRTVAAGRRADASDSDAHRVVGEFKGNLFSWDYQVGLSLSTSDVETSFTDGYVSFQKIQAGINGVQYGGKTLYLNPFGDPTADEQAYINSSKVTGWTQRATGETKQIDAKVSREIFELSGGAAALALGTEFRNEKFETEVNTEVTSQAAGSGLAGATGVSGERNVWAVYGELLMPVVKDLEVTLAARYDNYEGVGGSFNPKLGVRYQPMQNLMFRGSASTGFRAPTLYELNQPIGLTSTAGSYSDPVLCPDGNPVPGADPGRDCDQQFTTQTGGNADLEPEESTTYSLGVVFEPVKRMTVSVDYWNISLKKSIAAFPESPIFNNPTKYASRYTRCSALTPAQIANSIEFTASCSGATAGLDPIAYVDVRQDNLGETKTSGLDLSFGYQSARTDYGRFGFQIDGTYVLSYDYQREEGGEFVDNQGKYSDSSPVMRWQHVAALTWGMDAYSVMLAHRYKSGYEDKNEAAGVDPEYFQWTKAFQAVDLSLTYTGLKGLTLTGGINNLFDEAPPFSNQDDTFQVGYDPRIADPLGRSYFIRAGYTFK